jgi:HSP20 family protein
MKTLRHFNDLEVLFRDFFNTTSQFDTLTNSRYAYPVDIFESDKGLQIGIAAVGLKRDDIDIRIEDGDVLRITHKKESQESSEIINYIHKGIARRAFSFGWKVSAKFDLDRLTAKLEDGLLSILIPFSEKAEPKKIEIQ